MSNFKGSANTSDVTIAYADPENITQKLRDILLRLGIPCYANYLSIRLAAGLHAQDYKYLQRILGSHALPNHSCTHLVDYQTVIQIEDFDGSILYRLQTIDAELLIDRSPQHIQRTRRISYMTGPDSTSRHGASLAGFLQTAYGAKLPANRLEAGVALVVRLLPWYGIRFSMSCQGHPSNNGITRPRIYLFGQYHLRYLEHILTELFSDYSIAQTWSFNYYPTTPPTHKVNFDSDWSSGLLQPHPDWTNRYLQSSKEYRRVV